MCSSSEAPNCSPFSTVSFFAWRLRLVGFASGDTRSASSEAEASFSIVSVVFVTAETQTDRPELAFVNPLEDNHPVRECGNRAGHLPKMPSELQFCRALPSKSGIWQAHLLQEADKEGAVIDVILHTITEGPSLALKLALI